MIHVSVGGQGWDTVLGKGTWKNTETGNGDGEVGRVITRKEMTAALKGDG